VLYVLFRYPQISQTFVRDEIYALRAAGSRISVVSLDPAGPDAPAESWSGPVIAVDRPDLLKCATDVVWWFAHHPHRSTRFVLLALREGQRTTYMMRRGFSLARRIVADPPDHVHTHFAWDTATVVGGIATLLGTSSSITLHAKDIYAEPSRALRRRLDQFDRVLTVCHFNVGYLTAAGALRGRPDSARVIELGVAPPDHTDDQTRVHNVVAIGRLVEKKGFDVLLRALATLDLDPSRPWSATIVGDGPLRRPLFDLARQLGISERVAFTGSLPHGEALRILGGAQVFCLPSKFSADGDSDAMPVVLREAMVRGVPVIASRLAGIPESVDDEVGWLTEPGSVVDLAQALRQALAEPGTGRRRGQAGQARANHRWTFSRQASNLLELFDEAGRPRAI
jgi:colanic acid/amylovoran biosynthesis glycosyltransferase